PQTHLWLIKVWFSASTFVVNIATFAKPETVSYNLRTNTLLILDLDGVLLTNPSWRADRIHPDGYSDFDESCVENLNQLLTFAHFEIWLSSSRRTAKTLTEFNVIFKNRGIQKEIAGFLPEYAECKNRQEEISKFINEFNVSDFLIIDDDKSLNGLESEIKEKLILTELTKGFNSDKLKEATEKINKL
uniref:HAD domain-containing protein n=1 Tax=Pararhodonellum marinum TaxID=2755358 RepID=UPI00188F2F5D